MRPIIKEYQEIQSLLYRSAEGLKLNRMNIAAHNAHSALIQINIERMKTINPNFNVRAASECISDEDNTDLILLLSSIEGNGVTGNSMHNELKKYLPALRRTIAYTGYEILNNAALTGRTLLEDDKPKPKPIEKAT